MNAHAAAAPLATGYLLRLVVEAGRVTDVDHAGERALIGSSMLVGRSRAEALDLAPMLYALCPHAQKIALELAIEAALGEEEGEGVARDRDLLLLGELVAAHAITLLAVWPASLGERPLLAPIMAILEVSRTLPAALAGGAAHGPLADTLRDRAAMIAAASTATLPTHKAPRPPPAPLPVLGAPWFADRLDAVPNFPREPSFEDAAAEPGALARMHDDPALQALLTEDAVDAARLAARRSELAAIGAGTVAMPARRAVAADGVGTAVVETGRGPLAVSVRLERGRISQYTSSAPTEWHLRRGGVLDRALIGLPDDADLPARVTSALAAIDPCCACRIELPGGEAVYRA